MENKDKFFGYSLNELKHGDKGVLKCEGKWTECAVSVETDKDSTTWVHLCIEEGFLDGREAKEKFGYVYSLAIAEILPDGVSVIYEDDFQDISHFFLLEGEKAEPTLKKHWKFDSNYTADGIVLTIHDIETHEMIAYAIFSDGILAESVEEILKKKGYHTYNLKFNDRGQFC